MTQTEVGGFADVDRRVSENINTLLLRARMSRRRLSIAMGTTSHSAINRKMNGDGEWTLAEAVRAGEVLSASLAELVGDLPSYDEWLVRHQGLEPRTRWYGVKRPDLRLLPGGQSVNAALTPDRLAAGSATPRLAVVS